MIRDRQKWYLREWRLYRGYSLAKLAAMMDTSKSRLSELENGVSRYNQDVLEALAEALRCDPADLLMRNPLQGDALWSIWDQIPESDRPTALKMLQGLRRTGS